MNDIIAYFLPFAAAGIFAYKRSPGTLFTACYMLSWVVMGVFLRKIGQYEDSLMPTFLGILIDLFFIKVIVEYDMHSTVVAPALLISCVYGAACLVEDKVGGFALTEAYGWANIVFAVILITGAWYGDPGGGRIFSGGPWFVRLRRSIPPNESALTEEGR